MSKVIYEVTLSHDGKHRVSVKSDDAVLLEDALPLAKKIQQRLLEVDHSSTPKMEPSSQPEQSQQDQAPLCGVHSVPMALMNGKRGSFWSCHKMNEDGSWCNYRPYRGRSTPPSYSYPAA
jgi:hypothetical protein